MTQKIKALNVAIGLIVIGMNGAVSAQIQGAGSPSSSNLEALSPQPLPPKTTQAIQPNSGPNALNPQPLPPKTMQGIQPGAGINALNPQPLPPRDMQALRQPGVSALNPQPLPPNGSANLRTIRSLRESEGLPDTANVLINGKTANVGELRRAVVTNGSVAKVAGGVAQHKVNFNDRFGGGSAVASGATSGVLATKTWVKHDLPKERWKLIGCGDTHTDKHVRNHCNGSDDTNAQADAECVQKLLMNGVSGFWVAYCGGNKGPNAGGFHSKYNASRQEKSSGVDVYEIQINPACKFEHWWVAPYSTVKVDSMAPQRGTVRAIARWTTDRCISAKATFLGATVDEDYACFAGYYNTVTKAECPAGINP
jgi:hypothetical protein